MDEADGDESLMDETAEGYHSPYRTLQVSVSIHETEVSAADLSYTERLVANMVGRHHEQMHEHMSILAAIERAGRSATYTAAAPPRVDWKRKIRITNPK